MSSRSCGEYGACTVVVCRDCCDRTGCDLAGLTSLIGSSGLRPAACLGPCRYPNVLVVRPAPAARRAGHRPMWFGLLTAPAALTALGRWVAAGGPGAAVVPEVVARHAIAPPARTRLAVVLVDRR